MAAAELKVPRRNPGALTLPRMRSNAAGNTILQILDLNMAPDPISEGQTLQRLNLSLRVDATEECDTILTIKEANPPHDVVSIGAQTLKPGTNNLVLQPSARYRFQHRDTCFMVTADIAATSKPIDTQQRFCAKFVPPTGPARWSLR